MQFFKNLLFRFTGRRTRERMLQESLSDWRIIKVVNAPTNERHVVRIRIRKPSGIETSHYPVAISIEWRAGEGDTFPPPEVTDAMTNFERALDELTRERGLAELLQVVTSPGLRRWLFYATSYEEFAERLTPILPTEPGHPLQLTPVEDPEWRLWQETLAELSDAIASPE